MLGVPKVLEHPYNFCISLPLKQNVLKQLGQYDREHLLTVCFFSPLELRYCTTNLQLLKYLIWSIVFVRSNYIVLPKPLCQQLPGTCTLFIYLVCADSLRKRISKHRLTGVFCLRVRDGGGGVILVGICNEYLILVFLLKVDLGR